MNTSYVLTLLNTPSIGRKTVQHILNKFNHSVSSASDLIDVISEVKNEHSRIIIPQKQLIEKIFQEAESSIERSNQMGIKTLDASHPDFPTRLLGIPDAPVLIYVKGNIQSLNANRSVAIIGTREPTEFGSRAGEKLSSIFTQNKFVVVSGLAIGCDSVAHWGCLKEKGQTVAIMAGGLDKIYPKENRNLADLILEQDGCWLSEYPIGMTPRGNYFVERDRLQSGLSQAVIVIETDVKGGTMHTVGFSIKQGRYLACLNGHPEKYNNHPKIQGNKMLIREGTAKKLGSPEEIQNFIDLLLQSETKVTTSAIEANQETLAPEKKKKSESKSKKKQNPEQITLF